MSSKATPSPAIAQRIRRITESLLSLPTLPTVVSKMIELVDNPKTSAASLARLISTDQALTARILKLANSAYYGFSREISTVNMAIVVLGFNTVKDMGLSLSVLNVFKGAGSEGSFDLPKFWEHSIACGVASRMIARTYSHHLIGEAFVAGLLHDIGKVVLDQYAQAEFQRITALVAGGHDLTEAENAVMGTDHAHVGAWLAEKWKLPTVIVESIRSHHEPWAAVGEPLFVGMVTLADFLCHACGLGASGRGVAPSMDARVWELFRAHETAIDDSKIDELKAALFVEYDGAETFVSFIREQSAAGEEEAAAQPRPKPAAGMRK